ncbi:protein NODULATION SIGNALING PATHWAY 2-like [Bidens hawaiensis]|uniref:protein NODULATION SIGNALING PATHWAY 2-like n=1 Tax=Bidens hawaiensis TaxID=980011 RepID=UPI004049D5E3
MMQSEPMFLNIDLPLLQDGQDLTFFTSEDCHEVYSASTMNDFDDVCKWLCDDGDDDVQKMEEISNDSYVWSPNMSMNSSDACAYDVPYVITPSSMVDDVMETDSQTEMENLLTAHAEAVCLGQTELAKVIQAHVCQKASPVGPVLDKLALNLCDENQEKDYIVQESLKNFSKARRAFYEIFPYGRFAHFTANSTILESIPNHVASIHIVDFDLCEGNQWPPVIEAIARMNKSLIITSIKLDQDHDSHFEQKRWHLCNFARSFGLNLKVQETCMSQLIENMYERQQGSEFMVFNCMVGLPHMRKTRKIHQVNDFLKVAKFILTENQGIITFGDGEECERTGNHSDFPSFFNMNLAHYKALYESMECGFPSHLKEARIAMETLFLAPSVSSKSWFRKWQERSRFTSDFRNILGLKGVNMSKQSWDEQRELVKESETPYRIGIGENGNEFVLEWKGIPLVRVSAWM